MKYLKGTHSIEIYFVLITLSLLIFNMRYASSQPEFGIKGSFNNTWLLNENVFAQEKILNTTITPGNAFGFQCAYFITPRIGAGIELNFSTVNQKYHGKTATFKYEAIDKVQYLSIPVLLKLRSKKGFYFELGPEISWLQKGTESFTIQPDPDHISYGNRPIEQGLNHSVISGVFGFGGRFNLSKNTKVSAGLRFKGSFTDGTKKLSEPQFTNYLCNREFGIAPVFTHTDFGKSFGLKKTIIASLGVEVGVVYILKGK